MKGYYINGDYMGWVDDHYQKFPTEKEYDEYIAENEKEDEDDRK